MNRHAIRLRPGAAILIGAMLAMPAVPALGQTPDTAEGQRLANRWCSSCHLVEPGGPATEAAAPFPAIADDPEMSPERLRGWLAAPHPPMPDLSLSRQEIEAIAVYIESLRTTQ